MEKLPGARLKIERAKEHITDLADALRAFGNTNPCTIGTKRDPQTGQLIHYVADLQPTPEKIPLLAGDAIHSLRSALDHLAYRLVQVGTGATPTRHVYFPIADNAAKYKTESLRKIKGAAPAAIKAIDLIEPYQGGKGHQLWVLNKLNNTDKHRLLLTVGSVFRSVNLSAIALARATKAMPELEHLHMPDVFYRDGERSCPLKIGHQLLIDAPDAEVNPKLKFVFEVAIAEPEVPNSDPLLETLNHFANLVEGIVTQLATHL